MEGEADEYSSCLEAPSPQTSRAEERHMQQLPRTLPPQAPEFTQKSSTSSCDLYGLEEEGHGRQKTVPAILIVTFPLEVEKLCEHARKN